MDEAQIDEVLRMLPYASREDVMKDLTITQSVEHTINRILDGQVRLNKGAHQKAGHNWQTARKRQTTFTKMPPIGTLHVYKLCCCLRVRS